jgi:hypothetical protein
MTLQLITPPLYVGPQITRDQNATSYTLDALSEYVAFVIQAPKAGTIDRIHFFAGTVTADGDGLRCRIETVSGTNGNPSGTLVGGSSEVTHVTTTANSWNRGTAGLNAVVTEGQDIAVKLSSPAAGTTFNGVIRGNFNGGKGPGVDPANLLAPYLVNAIPTATKGAPSLMCFALEYDDGTCAFIDAAAPLSAVAGVSINTTTTPDERGNLFQVPVPIRARGVYHNVQGGLADFDVVIYDAANNVIASSSVDKDINRVLSIGSSVRRFTAGVSLAANTNYRVVLKPTTTTSITVYEMTVDTSLGGVRLRDAMCLSSWKKTVRTDGATTGGTLGDGWTQTDDSFLGLGLIVDQFDDGASAMSAPCLFVSP